MRIAIDAHMIGDHSGGNESYYTNILKNMTVDDKDTVYIFVKSGTPVEEYFEKFTVIEFEQKNAFKRNFFELPKLCKKYKIDVLHTQYFIPFFNPCPVVCTIHDICFEHFKDIFTKKEYITQKLLIPYAARKSDYIFTVSGNAKNDIAASYNIKKEKIVVTYDAVNDEFRKLSASELKSEELRSKYNITGDYILSVGNLQPRKNLVRLIKAYKILKKCNKIEEKLVIVGKKAWLYNDILKEVLNDDGDVIFTDYVEQSDLIRLYNDAKCFIYPSLFEGFGIPPLEAMACGNVVGVSNTSSLPEVVGDAGLYFNPYEEEDIARVINELLNNSKLIEDLKGKSKARVDKFNWKHSADLIMDCYHSLDKNG